MGSGGRATAAVPPSGGAAGEQAAASAPGAAPLSDRERFARELAAVARLFKGAGGGNVARGPGKLRCARARCEGAEHIPQTHTRRGGRSRGTHQPPTNPPRRLHSAWDIF